MRSGPSGAKHVADNNQKQLKIWGRANSVNVQKVLWCLRELDLGYERIDAGMAFGRNREPDYLAMNPNGRVPTLVDGGFVLWESNSIMRYLVLAYAEAVQWRIVDAQLATRRFIEGDDFTLADIALGAYARRWFGVEGISKPQLAHLERWFAQFAGRAGFAQFVAPPMS